MSCHFAVIFRHKYRLGWNVEDSKTVITNKKQRYPLGIKGMLWTLNQPVAGSNPASPICLPMLKERPSDVPQGQGGLLVTGSAKLRPVVDIHNKFTCEDDRARCKVSAIRMTISV